MHAIGGRLMTERHLHDVRAEDASDANLVILRHFDFGDKCHVCPEHGLSGNTPATLCDNACPQSGILRGKRVDEGVDDEDIVRRPTLHQNAVAMPGGSTRKNSTCRFGMA
jgi:hypothetical protein